jgi:hypothetical protein
MELLKRTKVEEELKIAKREGLLNIQLLTIRSLLHSSSTSKCVKGKVYNKKIQFAQVIIRDVNTTRTSVIEFLRKSKRYWRPKDQTRPRTTSIDPMFIEEPKDDKAVEQHFVVTQTMEKDTREENIIEVEEQLSLEIHVEVQQATKVQGIAETQQRAMEVERHEAEVVMKKRCVILDKTTLLEKGIKILDPKRFMWTQMKQNYDKHVERMEN